MDEIDYSTAVQQSTEDKAIAAIRAKAAGMPEGVAGECAECGEESQRLIMGRCAPCRDREDKAIS